MGYHVAGKVVMSVLKECRAFTYRVTQSSEQYITSKHGKPLTHWYNNTSNLSDTAT
jgi:hypothetical protein